MKFIIVSLSSISLPFFEVHFNTNFGIFLVLLNIPKTYLLFDFVVIASLKKQKWGYIINANGPFSTIFSFFTFLIVIAYIKRNVQISIYFTD